MVKRSREDSPPSTAPSPLFAGVESSASSPQSVDLPSHSAKYIHVDCTLSQQAAAAAASAAVMKCSLPPHQDTLAFSTFEDFEVHYAQIHTNRCSECRRNFPTEHFLSLHIDENHDPLNEARRAKGEKTYRCFVQDCTKICSSPQKRRMHLTDKHLFPKTYDFLIVNSGVDKRSSMLRTRHHRRPSSSAASRALARSQQQQQHQNANGIAAKSSEAPPTNEYDEENIPPSSSSPPNSNLAHSPDTPMLSTLSSSSPAAASSQEPTDQDVDVESITKTMSALRFVPPSIRFGRRGGKKTGLSRT